MLSRSEIDEVESGWNVTPRLEAEKPPWGPIALSSKEPCQPSTISQNFEEKAGIVSHPHELATSLERDIHDLHPNCSANYFESAYPQHLDSERRAAFEIEMEFARDVQSRLFPRKMPPLETLEYAGGCVEARVVGGDYYDFLDLGPGRLAFILADIAGKGIAGALLMANLQAILHSQYALTPGDLPLLLKSVNRIFCENIPDGRFASLVLAHYEDAGRHLRYVNCGHNYPLLFRADGTLERLSSTATVLGVFKDWDCETADIVLHPGDTMVMYTDGVTEARNADGVEFGEQRLVQTIRAQCGAGSERILAGVHSAVQQYSNGVQADDLALVVACAR
jgi:serine phosphatase RsbU (regulator of sigma subunit)